MSKRVEKREDCLSKKAYLDELLEKQRVLEHALNGLEQERMQVEGAGGLLLDDVEAVLDEPLHLDNLFVLKR